MLTLSQNLIKLTGIINNCCHFYSVNDNDSIENMYVINQQISNIKKDKITNSQTIANSNKLNKQLEIINNYKINKNINTSMVIITSINTKRNKFINPSNTQKYINDDDSLFTCNYCKKKCIKEIYRYMDYSYCSLFCRNQKIKNAELVDEKLI